MNEIETSLKIFKIGMKINQTSKNPDPLIIYNNGLMDQKYYNSKEEVWIKSLLRLKESHERNLLILALRLKQKNGFNADFFKFRHFNKNFFEDEGLKSLLKICYNFMDVEGPKLKKKAEILSHFNVKLK